MHSQTIETARHYLTRLLIVHLHMIPANIIYLLSSPKIVQVRQNRPWYICHPCPHSTTVKIEQVTTRRQVKKATQTFVDYAPEPIRQNDYAVVPRNRHVMHTVLPPTEGQAVNLSAPGLVPVSVRDGTSRGTSVVEGVTAIVAFRTAGGTPYPCRPEKVDGGAVHRPCRQEFHVIHWRSNKKYREVGHHALKFLRTPGWLSASNLVSAGGNYHPTQQEPKRSTPEQLDS